MNYKSPIELYTTQQILQIVEQQDEQVFSAVQKVGVNVDKTELIKALQYDRGQYEKGFQDGKKATVREILQEVYNEFAWFTDDSTYEGCEIKAIIRTIAKRKGVEVE
jgi:hypothetical protein